VFLGIDIRTSETAAVVVDASGHVTARASELGRDPAAVVSAARAATARHPAAAAGIVARNPASEEAHRLGASVAQVLDKSEASIVTPGAAVALAEQWCGAARGAGNVVVFTAADLVHAGVIVDGKLLRGAHGTAGSAGWLALNPVEREDYRRLGCLEAEVGEIGIVRRLVWRIKAGDRSRVVEMAGGQLGVITAQQIFDAARSGDGVAISVVRDTARYLGMALANLIAIVDPDVVVVGGMMASASDLLLEPSRLEMCRRLSAAAAQVPVVPATLGEGGAAIGAARAAMLASE